MDPWPTTHAGDFCGSFQFRVETSLEALAEKILAGTLFTLADLKGRDRHQDIHRVRTAFVRRARQEKYTYASIGRFLNRDHGTIIHLDKESKV